MTELVDPFIIENDQEIPVHKVTNMDSSGIIREIWCKPDGSHLEYPTVVYYTRLSFWRRILEWII
jgi:hypothetical protein